MKKLKVIKIGGKMVDDVSKLNRILDTFSQIDGHKILVHGGASQTDHWLGKMGVSPNKIAGRRITDKATLDVCVMIYAGLLNTQLVADLSKRSVLALGMTGADLNSIQCVKRPVAEIDYGFAGDLKHINTDAIEGLLNQHITPVFCAITHDNDGQLLNTNGDTIAASLAESFSQNYEVELQFIFDRNGVVRLEGQKEIVIRNLTKATFSNMLDSNEIKDGLIPKLENGFQALNNGIQTVRLGSPDIMIDSSKGTKLVMT